MENFITKMSIKGKIITLTVLVALFVMVVSTFIAIKDINKSLMEANRQKVEEMTEMVFNLLDGYKKKVDRKELTLPQAQSMAIANIRSMRYEGQNYIWLNNYNAVMITHPTLTGKSVIDVTDKNGYKFFYEGTEDAKKNGSAFINYYWTKQGESSTKYYPKVSHFRNYEPWHWIIATGIYVDEVDQIVLNTFLQILLVNIIALAVIIVVVLFTMVKEIVDSMEKISKELDESSDEVSTAAIQLESAAQKLAEGGTEQAASIQETSSTLEETESMVQQNRANTQQAAVLAKQSKEYADHSMLKCIE